MARAHVPTDPDAWLAAFHRGDRAVIADLYETHFDMLHGAVGQIVGGWERESVIHDVFARLISSPEMRARFAGGSIAGWLRTVARNQALDMYRRERRMTQLEPATVVQPEAPESDYANHDAATVRALLTDFRERRLPGKWHAVFDAVYVRQLSQRDAAQVIGISRTTLAYQAMRVRTLLERFFLEESHV